MFTANQYSFPSRRGGLMLVHDHLQMKTKVIDFLPDIPDAHDLTKDTSSVGEDTKRW